MKQVIVQSFCDLCIAEEQDEEVPAVAEEHLHSKVLDVCERHQMLVRQRIRELDALFALGVDVETPSPRRPRGGGGRHASVMKNSVEWRTCPICGHVAPTRSANGQHLKQRHDRKLLDFDWPETSEST